MQFMEFALEKYICFLSEIQALIWCILILVNAMKTDIEKREWSKLINGTVDDRDYGGGGLLILKQIQCCA